MRLHEDHLLHSDSITPRIDSIRSPRRENVVLAVSFRKHRVFSPLGNLSSLL